MSNRQVPTVYRSVMNDVIENVRADFDEAGVEEAVLQGLLRSWESKVAQSRVADFTADPRMGAIARQFPARTLNEVMANANAAAATATTSTASASTNGANGEASTSATDEPAAKKQKTDDKDGTDEASKKKKNESSSNEDENEINSDLDDSDDEQDGDENGDGVGGGDDGTGDLVIALYEKVQRVKNKWKITLKDGLISVGGRDYLFSKCQGEFEW